MILGDMLNRIDENIGVLVMDSAGYELAVYDDADSIDKSLNDYDVIFPISIWDNKIVIWIDKDSENQKRT